MDHRTRRMFCYRDGCLSLAPQGDQRGHAEWMTTLGLDWKRITRGYIADDRVALYLGDDFRVPKDSADCLEQLGSLCDGKEVWIGLHVGVPGEIWQPIHRHESAAVVTAASSGDPSRLSSA